jgi:hypothetical protein
MTKWSIRGPHFVNCNCDFGCPCQFNALPSDGTCRALVAWHIDKGHYGDVSLDGLNVVNTYGWPGAVHQGNGEMQSIIDQRASEAQRAALASIMKGEGAEPGLIMLQIYRSMCTTVHDPIVAPIDLRIDMDGRSAHLSVPGVVEATVGPIVNPVTGAQHRARIDLPLGKEFFLAEVASGTTKATGKVGLDFAGSHAHIAINEMSSEGPRA